MRSCHRPRQRCELLARRPQRLRRNSQKVLLHLPPRLRDLLRCASPGGCRSKNLLLMLQVPYQPFCEVGKVLLSASRFFGTNGVFLQYILT